ncbi:uncharacterized protein LOC101896627 isoform X4 [Musca domestica]|uniref:limulus clotting factor C n=1 Tax=Musca domestica TaxID=7370 RepID=A0A1I8N3D3_MUSDO|nr:uncharacterized protein LOC101896627 isoform X4 [Musca domestica]
MWNINSKKMKWHFVNLVLWANLLLIGGVKATYTSGVKTSVYTSDPQITTQTYTTRHQSHQYVPITGEYHYGHNPNNLGNNGNDNDYQMTITHQSRGSSPQWTSSSSSSSMHGSIDNSYQQPQQHESSYRYHHQQQRQPQPQPQPIYERHPTGHATQQTSGRIQQIENDITDYYTGCPSGHTGQLPYAYDCRRFLNCWKGRGHIQSCSVGTVFNPETLECDRPDKVKCAAGLVGSHVAGKTTQGHLTQTATTSTNRAGRYIDDTTESVDMLCPSGSQGLEPHPADCTKFINCANGNVHVQQCGPGTAFSIPMKVCDFKEKVDCSGRSEATAEVHVHSTQGAKADRSQVKCPSGASGLYPHPYDCTKFLQCSNGITYIQDCGPGTGFDSNLKVCDYKEKIHCVAGSSWGTSSHSFNSYGEHGATEFEAVNENVQCPPGASGLHPHPQDCEKFLQCSNGQTFIQNCGPGTGFDSLRLVCDYKEKVQCGSGSVWAITTDVTTVQHGHTQHTTPPNSGGGPNDLPHTSDILCLNGITGLFPYPFDYTKFINCKNGNTAIQNCVQGTAFSISKGYCESLEQIQKIDHVLYIVSEVSYEYAQTLITCPPGTEGIHLYPFNAEKYIKCVHSQMEVIGCNPSQVFSTTRRMCLPRNQVLKTERVRLLSELQKTNNYRNIEEHFDVHTMIYCPMGLSGAYPHPFDSSKYITCSGGRMISESCASGKAFSLSRKHCEMKEDLEARDRVPPIETSYGQEWHISDMETTYGSIDGLTYLMCPPGLSGYFLHPFDCTKYIECSNGATNIDGCANGAVFSISRKQCILRDRVEAYDRVEYLTTTKHEFSNEHVLQADRDLGISCGPGTFGIYPHPQDGHKFMRCANGRIAVENCPPGQVFSIERSSCYNENDVSQYDRSSYVHGQTQGQGHYNRGGARGTTATTTTTTTSTTNNNNHNTLPYYTPSNAEVNCPSPNSNGRYPHPYDCTKFVMCSNGVAHIQSCGPGTAWNKAMEVCDYMDKVECSQSQATTSTTATTSTNPVKQHQPEIQCPPGAEGLFMHPYDWHKYLSCTNGYTHIMDCSPGTVFSVTRKVCDLERNVANTDRCNNGVYSTNYDYSYTQGYNNPGTQSYGSGSNNQWSHTTVTQHQPPTHTYTQQTHTTTQQAGGDRWTNMNIPRPQGSSSSSYDQHSTGWQAVPAGRPVTTNVWSGTAINVDRQEPTHTVIYEEGSLQPDREQHSLVTTTSVQPGAHKSGTVYDFQHTTVESQHSIHFPHDHDQSATTTTTNWHKHHQHTPSSSKHHHQHSRDFHEKHPNLPNPFDAPLESSGIDVRINDNSCPFSCGNGKCVAQHEVCNGVNNCGNRKDEEQCDHLGYEVRLTGGESSNKGRVEVKILGKWGYVCDDKFGLKDADVVCRELGFKMGAMEVRGSSYYPPADTNAVFNMDEVECKGNETSLRECDFKGWGVNNCGPDEVVGVVCKVQQLKCPDNYWLCTKSEECIPTAFLCDVTPDCSDGSDESPQICNAPIEYRLEGGRSKNEGRLEIFYRGEWGTVCDDDFSQKEAQVVCNSLGYYDKAQVAKNIYGPGSGPIWLDQVSCLGNETTLDKCNHWTWGENNCQHTEDVGIKCTAGPKPTILRPVVTTTPATRISNKDSEYELSELDDLGKYQGLWQRSSKAVHQPKQCGHFKKNLVDEYAHPEERVINGSIAKRGRHPWQATIRTRGRGGISSHWCGAVIISKKLILTAAHCLAGYPKGSYFVRVGDHYANIAEASEVDSNIENWYIHERFREEKHMNNDIALILLKNSLRFNDYVQPICLPEKGSQLQANRMCTISGWGSIKSGTSTPSNILRAAEVPILAEDVCHRKNVYGNAMSEGMFCAGYLDENVDACDGDSGGPLVCSDEGGETLYGIISWGQHCGYANHPGVYVRVEKYIDWIYEKINLMLQQGKL